MKTLLPAIATLLLATSPSIAQQAITEGQAKTYKDCNARAISMAKAGIYTTDVHAFLRQCYAQVDEVKEGWIKGP